VSRALVFGAGVAALSWEVLWQVRIMLAVGVSATATAITLVATMTGMTLGALLAGRALAARALERPFLVYGALEATIGLWGVVVVAPGAALLSRLDVAVYAVSPALAALLQLVGLILLLGPQTMAMGATAPLFGRIAWRHGGSVASLYAANTAGGCLGVLLVSFVVLPYVGVDLTGFVLAGIDLIVELGAVVLASRARSSASHAASHALGDVTVESAASLPSRLAVIVFATGFVGFGLEVAWFRAMRSAFFSTTQTFAILLASVLGPLALGARLAPWLGKRRVGIGGALAGAGIAILAATPLLERFDWVPRAFQATYWRMTVVWLAASIVTVGPAMLLIGTGLPWALDELKGARLLGRAYALNAIGAVLGSLCAAWLLLPWLGFSRTSWLLGSGMATVAIVSMTGRVRFAVAAAGIVTLAVAVGLESGIGRVRVVGNIAGGARRVIAYREEPDATIAVVETTSGDRTLVIDGFAASTDAAGSHYMPWMGHLPMLRHEGPEVALVICFGTGQTANAVRQEEPRELDVVDVSAGVFALAPFFAAKNQDVLSDSRVHAIVMDGRAWLRRTTRVYDVITLEPMPPNFAGVNALYSREFYELAAAHLGPAGVIAQWLPFHTLTVHDARAIVATFQAVFADAYVWVDPTSTTGIVVGGTRSPLADPAVWPGFARQRAGRDMTPAQVLGAIALGPREIERYTRGATLITDDNQLLAYGPQRHANYYAIHTATAAHFAALARARASE